MEQLRIHPLIHGMRRKIATNWGYMPTDEMKYTIKTSSFENGIIEQELYRKTPTCEERVMRWVMDTRETGIRDALVKLGWTPPGKPEREEPLTIHDLYPGHYQKGCIHCADMGCEECAVK